MKPAYGSSFTGYDVAGNANENNMNRRALIAALMVGALCQAAWAQPFPQRPVKLIVPFAAGGAADLFARTLASGMGTELGQQVFIEVHAGVGGLTGVDAAAKSAPDGYTICFSGAAALSAFPFMLSRMPFDWQKDLALLTIVVRVPEAVIVTPRSASIRWRNSSPMPAPIPARSISARRVPARSRTSAPNY